MKYKYLKYTFCDGKKITEVALQLLVLSISLTSYADDSSLNSKTAPANDSNNKPLAVSKFNKRYRFMQSEWSTPMNNAYISRRKVDMNQNMVIYNLKCLTPPNTPAAFINNRKDRFRHNESLIIIEPDSNNPHSSSFSYSKKSAIIQL